VFGVQPSSPCHQSSHHSSKVNTNTPALLYAAVPNAGPAVTKLWLSYSSHRVFFDVVCPLINGVDELVRAFHALLQQPVTIGTTCMSEAQRHCRCSVLLADRQQMHMLLLPLTSTQLHSTAALHSVTKLQQHTIDSDAHWQSCSGHNRIFRIKHLPFHCDT
jgi:hypothetical protein